MDTHAQLSTLTLEIELCSDKRTCGSYGCGWSADSRWCGGSGCLWWAGRPLITSHSLTAAVIWILFIGAIPRQVVILGTPARFQNVLHCYIMDNWRRMEKNSKYKSSCKVFKTPNLSCFFFKITIHRNRVNTPLFLWKG
jgi:hypothetical protein